MFDRGYVTVDEDFRFVVGERLTQDYDNGRAYYQMAGEGLARPSGPALVPDPEALRWHREHRFVG